jgi:hypothetical protein
MKPLIERAVMLVSALASIVENFFIAGQGNMRGSGETALPSLQIIGD